MLVKINEDPEIYVLTSNNAHFHLNGYVNKQNFCYWASANS